MPETSPALTVLLDESDWARHLARQTSEGLRADPPWTPPVWFYDAVGSELFERITDLPEYYPTRTEREILVSAGAEIARLTQAESLLELGSGSSEKTRLLLRALVEGGTLRRFVPIDCSQPALIGAREQLAVEFPDIDIEAIVADFNVHLPQLPRGDRHLLVFLGSTIGNLNDEARAAFLSDVAAHLESDDSFLLGTDLVKEPARLVAAYNDEAGVTAAFNLNALSVMNRQLGSDFDASRFHHEAIWNADQHRIEIRVVADADQRVSIPALDDLVLELSQGEWIQTEISVKFTRESVARELAAAGMAVVEQWSDDSEDFLVTLARRC